MIDKKLIDGLILNGQPQRTLPPPVHAVLAQSEIVNGYCENKAAWRRTLHRLKTSHNPRPAGERDD